MAAVAEEDPFEELEEWSSREDIRDAYGYDAITEKEMDRLMELWDLREQQKEQNRGKPEYEDRITIMLDWAMDHLQGAFRDRLAELEETEAIVDRDVTQIVQKHNEKVRSW